MRTIIAGSRDIISPQVLRDALLYCPWEITHVISGGARGVDKLGEYWAIEHDIPFTRHLADWDLFGKAAGHVRNNEMAKDAEALLAVWDSVSKGTGNMITQARRLGLKMHIYIHDA